MLSELLLDVLDWRVAVPAILLGLLAYWLYEIRRPGLPPGPFPWPLYGNLGGMSAGPFDQVMLNWRKQYGDAFMFYIGTQRAVVISGVENIKSFYVDTGDDFVDRPPLHAFVNYSKGFKGIMLSSGQLWKENRKVATAGMRDMMGAGQQSLQAKVIQEATALREELAEMEGQPFDVKPYLNSAVFNVICSMVFGKRYERGDPELTEVADAIHSTMEVSLSLFLVNYMPWLRYIPFMPSVHALDKPIEQIDSCMARKIAEHRDTFDPSKPPRDFIDFFLKVEHDSVNEEGEDKEEFDEENMQVVIKDMFFAGGHTIVTTLTWAILFLVLNKDVQKRCREEIHEAIGKDGTPDMDTRQKLRYVEATIHETMRLGDIVPVNDPRIASRDMELVGFTIPKGTPVMPLMTAIHRSSEYWEEPYEFRPERWLDSEGKLIRHEAFMPFSLGRRNCIGKSIARVELFTFLTMLLQQFSFSLPEGQSPPSVEGVIGIMRLPEEYQVVVSKVD